MSSSENMWSVTTARTSRTLIENVLKEGQYVGSHAVYNPIPTRYADDRDNSDAEATEISDMLH